MVTIKTIVLKTNVQVITFETKSHELGKSFATSEKRISLLEASDILEERGIEYKEILKVKYELVEMEIPLDQFNSFLL